MPMLTFLLMFLSLAETLLQVAMVNGKIEVQTLETRKLRQEIGL